MSACRKPLALAPAVYTRKRFWLGIRAHLHLGKPFGNEIRGNRRRQIIHAADAVFIQREAL